MVRMVLRWIDSPWAFELLPGLNKLGRNPTNDFRVSDPSVSSFHAELVVEDEEIRVRDLGSTNGTYIDDIKVDEGLLAPGKILRLGNVRFQLEEVFVTPNAHPPTSTSSPPAPVGTSVEFGGGCLYHPDKRAAYKCENCGSALCQDCVTVVGQGKYDATTVCPVCKGQCYALAHPTDGAKPNQPSLLHRLTQTLRLPFTR